MKATEMKGGILVLDHTKPEPKMGIFNSTKIPMDKLEEWALSVLPKDALELPSFYILVKPPNADGICITNLDRPTIVISFKDERQFKKVLRHELVHLQQHRKGYENEAEAEKAEADLK